MKVLYVEPLRHPRVVEIVDDADVLIKLIKCEYIECVYPFKEEVVLICDDCGMISGKQIPNRKVGRNIIFGPFILAGIDEDRFISLTEEQVKRYQSMFYYPELFRRDESGIEVIKIIKENEA